MGEELSRRDLVHPTHHRCDGVDMTSRHVTGGERVFEVGQVAAHLLAVIGGASVTRRFAAVTRQQIGGLFAAALLGELRVAVL